MEYKDTLNLPRTDFPMKADLVTREPERLKKWEAANLYAKIQAARAGAEKFVLHDGPPFANGDVHIGTALNKILKDIIVKYKTLRGNSAPYIPGWDCHGLPIEFKVSQEMRKAGDTTADAATIRKACEAYARKYIDLQRTQFKRLGVLGDWENPYLTLNKEYEADELRLFADIVEKGFVYRGKKPVYWSIPCRTALAEAEVEYQDHVSQSVFVKFPVVGQPNTFIVIWTTTPWTLPANLAVAYNKDFQYVKASVGDENYILFRGLLPAVARKMRLDQLHRNAVPDRRTGEVAISTSVLQPHRQTSSPPISSPATPAPASSTSRPATAWTTTISAAQNGLPIYSPVDDDGKFALHERFAASSSRCPPRWSANPFWKNTARATRTKPCCTNFASATRCCIRKIIITAIRIAGAAKRPSFSARWTSGSLKLIMMRRVHSFQASDDSRRLTRLLPSEMPLPKLTA